MADALFLVSPAIVLIAAAAVLPFLRGRAQDAWFVAAPLVALALVWVLPEGQGAAVDWLGLVLHPLAVDSLSRLFGTAFGIAASAGALFALPQESPLERSAALLYAGAALGVVFAGDLVTLFVFWEVMAIGSTLVLWSNGDARAGMRYALMHVFGGVLFLAGLVAEAGATGDVALHAMRVDTPGRALLLAGILVNAGALPVSAWVADAYPRASWSGAVFLSAFTTKAAVAVLIRLFPGEGSLVGIGIAMAVYGLLYALVGNDIRRMLAHSIVSQVGFMVVAVGIGTPLALAAAAAHAFAHILYKALLMMAAGSVLRATGTARLTGLGGLGRRMPLSTLAFIVGGLSLSAFPLTAGFISKSAILQAAGEAHAAGAWFALTAISAGSVLYAALRLPWFAMLRPRATIAVAPTPLPMRIAQAAVILAILGIGAAPGLFATLAPGLDAAPAYTAAHIVFQLELVAAASICFVLLLRLLSPAAGITTDLDWLWRDLPRHALDRGRKLAARLLEPTIAPIGDLQRKMAESGDILQDRLRRAGHWRTGEIALVATALLGASLLIAAL